MRKTKVVIAEDHDILIDGYKVLLGTCNVEIVGLFQNGLELIEWSKSNFYDLLILDIEMPELDGVGVLEYFQENNMNIKTLVVSDHHSETFIERFQDSLLKGFVSKTDVSYLLEDAINAIIDGGSYFVSLPVKEKVESDYLKSRIFEKDLSEREKELLPMLEHYNYNDIATEKELSVNTVKTYFKRIREKLGVSKNIELVNLLIRWGQRK